LLRRLTPKLLALAGLAALIAFASFGVFRYRHRYVRSDGDLVALLPRADATVLFVDSRALRQAHLLTLFSSSQTAEQPDYENFVRQTGFRFTEDLDRLVLSIGAETTYGAAIGKWNWTPLRQYARKHGGTCRDAVCFLPAITPGRWISFGEIQPDVLGLSISPDKEGVQALLANRGRSGLAISPEPVWMTVAPHLLHNPAPLPLPAKIFLISVQSADLVTFSLRPVQGRDYRFELQLHAQAPNAGTASSIADQLRIQTNTLQGELKREGRAPQADDLTGLLVAGSFHAEDRTAIGTWPIRDGLLNSLR
jgi:hypothetical protein